MAKRARGIMTVVVGSLLAVGGLSFSATAAEAASLTVDPASGSAGGQATVSVSLAKEGDPVVGVQNDLGFTADTPVAVRMSCLITSSQSCTTDADCPFLDPEDESLGREPCMERPDCTPLAADKIVFFGLLTEPGCTENCACTGESCTGLRAIAISLMDLDPIDDGSLYSCRFNIASDASEGDKPLMLDRVQMSDMAGASLCGAPDQVECGANDGAITVGPPGEEYVVCDVVEFSGDDAGQFGDGFKDIFDVRAIFAAAQLGVDRPADGTARFSAMDSDTEDSPPACGGDELLDIFDVRRCFNVAQLGFTNYVRSGTGASCTSMEEAP